MKNYSLSTKVSIAFGFCLFLLCLLFFLLSTYQSQRNEEKLKERYFQSINYLVTLYKNHTPPGDIEIYFKNFGLKRVLNKDLMNSVLSQGNTIFNRITELGKLSTILYNGKYYLYLDNIAVHVLLESGEKLPQNNYLFILFLVTSLLIVWVYFSTLKSIKPLNSLRKVVRKFANGDMDIECKSDRGDEIGELSNEFDKAIKTIRDLLRSRQLFLRTIMHELKTPIGKGRIVTEMVGEEVQKKRLRDVFERLELLINEFSKVEQLISKNYSFKKQEYSLETIFEHAFDIMLLEPEQIGEKVNLKIGDNSFHIKSDLDSMALAFKNLMENAIKYGSEHKVSVHLEGTTLYFCNKGEELKRSIDEYKQAFVTSAKKGENSFGLGLYIVESILKLHSLRLEYKYENGHHYFFIKLTEA